MKPRLSTVVALLFSALLAPAAASAQIPNQLAQDFEAGRAPTAAEVAQFEKDLAAKPGDLRLTRKLGKAYFFQFFGDGITEAVPKATSLLEKALTIKPDDAEAMAYLASLHVLQGQRIHTKDAAKQKAAYDKGFEMVKKAEALEPRHGAVLSVAAGTYIWLPDSYGMSQHVVDMLEGMIKGMGPYFQKFAHHGQQRILITLGQAYARMNQPEKAKIKFEEALKVNDKTDEAIIARKELRKFEPTAKTN